MTYSEAIDWLYELRMLGSKLGLKNPRALAAHGLRLGQGSRVDVTVPAMEGEKPVYLQYDGEAQPFERGVRYVFERQFSVRAPS